MLSMLTTAIDVVNNDNNENPPCDAALADESALRADALVGPYRLLREIGAR